jgi:hypothetical protein
LSDKPPTMNELLRAASGHLTPSQRAELERRVREPEQASAPVTGSADGGQLGGTSDPMPSASQVLNAAVADAIWSKRHGRPRARTLDELRYTGRLEHE